MHMSERDARGPEEHEHLSYRCRVFLVVAALHDASVGLAVVMWSYPRGGKLDKAGETVLDVCAYAAHMAALLGAHIIKGRRPTCCGSPRPRPPLRSHGFASASIVVCPGPPSVTSWRHRRAIELGGPTIDRFDTGARTCEMPLF